MKEFVKPFDAKKKDPHVLKKLETKASTFNKYTLC